MTASVWPDIGFNCELIIPDRLLFSDVHEQVLGEILTTQHSALSVTTHIAHQSALIKDDQAWFDSRSGYFVTSVNTELPLVTTSGTNYLDEVINNFMKRLHTQLQSKNLLVQQ